VPGKKNIEKYLLVIIVAATVLVIVKHARFSLGQTEPFGRDWDFHVQLSYVIQGSHFSYEKILDWYKKDESHSVHYTPLFYLVSSLVESTGIFGPLESIYLSQIVWITVLIFSMYAAGKSLGRSPWAGFAATAIAGLNFLVLYTESSDINPDFPAMAMVALAIATFYSTDGFLKRKESILLGICCALAFLTKAVVLVYLIPFLGSALLFPDPARQERTGPKLRNVTVSLLAALIVAGTFVVPLLPLFFKKLIMETDSVHLQEVVLHIKMYLQVFGYSLCTIVVLIGLVPTIFLLRNKDRNVIPYAISTACAVLFFIKMRTVAIGYFFPLQVWSGLLWARWTSRWSEKAKRIGCIGLGLAFIAPLVVTNPAETWNRWITFDRHTQEHISRLTVFLSDTESFVEENDVGYLLPNSGGATTLRRGMFGSAVALARPGNPWSGLLQYDGENVALFCQEGLEPEKIKRIRQKRLVVTFLPLLRTEVQDGCMASLMETIGMLRLSHRLELEIPYHLDAAPQSDPSAGFTTDYVIQLFRKD